MGVCASSTSRVTEFAVQGGSPVKATQQVAPAAAPASPPVLPNAVAAAPVIICNALSKLTRLEPASTTDESPTSIFLRLGTSVGLVAADSVTVVKKGALDELIGVLDATPSLLNVRGMWDSTPLIVACQYARTDVAAYLLSKGADPLLVNEKNVSPLLLACLEGLTTIVAMLVQEAPPYHLFMAVSVVYNGHADQNQALSPFIAACANGHLECVGLLLQAVSAPAAPLPVARLVNDSPEPSRVPAPLLAAAAYGQTHVLVMLLGYGAVEDIVDAERNTVLLLALKHGHDAAAVALVKALKDPALRTAVNATGNSALHLAADKGCLETCKALLALAVAVDDINGANETPLFLAAKRRDGRMLELFIRAGADIDRMLSNGSGRCVRDILIKDKRLNLIQIADSLRGKASMTSSEGSIVGSDGNLPPVLDALVIDEPRPGPVGRKTRITFSKQLGAGGLPLLGVPAADAPPPVGEASPVTSTRRTRTTFSKPVGVPLVPLAAGEQPSDASPEARLGSVVRRGRPTFSKPGGAALGPLGDAPPDAEPGASPIASPRKTRATFSKPVGVPLVPVPAPAPEPEVRDVGSFSLLDTSGRRLGRIQSAVDDDIQDRLDAMRSQKAARDDEDEEVDAGTDVVAELPRGASVRVGSSRRILAPVRAPTEAIAVDPRPIATRVALDVVAAVISDATALASPHKPPSGELAAQVEQDAISHATASSVAQDEAAVTFDGAQSVGTKEVEVLAPTPCQSAPPMQGCLIPPSSSNAPTRTISLAKLDEAPQRREAPTRAVSLEHLSRAPSLREPKL
ncbi:hypothetical protein ACHHYP_07616 [Achlya hypogyna]|uniref:Uncharacterized protein n=1 Tax=Achlya hypogyna TaxID=1202772 RepID=A0A1V9ZLM8_ACHHY|nr:hypothetical protein ACHHYP_07616 [Achlya hypogyna]